MGHLLTQFRDPKKKKGRRIYVTTCQKTFAGLVGILLLGREAQLHVVLCKHVLFPGFIILKFHQNSSSSGIGSPYT
jgi:hypothetical protein